MSRTGNLTTATVFATDAENRLTRSVTGSVTTTYTWDPAGHLAGVTSADATVTYAHGISRMREQKTIERRGVEAVWTKSVWAGDTLLSEPDCDGCRYTYL